MFIATIGFLFIFIVLFFVIRFYVKLSNKKDIYDTNTECGLICCLAAINLKEDVFLKKIDDGKWEISSSIFRAIGNSPNDAYSKLLERIEKK